MWWVPLQSTIEHCTSLLLVGELFCHLGCMTYWKRFPSYGIWQRVTMFPDIVSSDIHLRSIPVYVYSNTWLGLLSAFRWMNLAHRMHHCVRSAQAFHLTLIDRRKFDRSLTDLTSTLLGSAYRVIHIPPKGVRRKPRSGSCVTILLTGIN